MTMLFVHTNLNRQDCRFFKNEKRPPLILLATTGLAKWLLNRCKPAGELAVQLKLLMKRAVNNVKLLFACEFNKVHGIS